MRDEFNAALSERGVAQNGSCQTPRSSVKSGSCLRSLPSRWFGQNSDFQIPWCWVLWDPGTLAFLLINKWILSPYFDWFQGGFFHLPLEWPFPHGGNECPVARDLRRILQGLLVFLCRSQIAGTGTGALFFFLPVSPSWSGCHQEHQDGRGWNI